MTVSPTPTEAEKVVAEWRAAMEGVPAGPWRSSPWHIEEGPSAVYVKDGWVLCPLSADRHAEYIARCSPSGISALLALIESQLALIESRDDELIGERWHADEAARQRDVWKARALAAEARVTALEAALAAISYHYDNQDLSHLDFRVKAAECTRAALSSTEVKNDG